MAIDLKLLDPHDCFGSSRQVKQNAIQIIAFLRSMEDVLKHLSINDSQHSVHTGPWSIVFWKDYEGLKFLRN